MHYSKPGSRASSRTSIELFLTCLGQRAASVADQLDRPPAPLDLVSRTESSPMLVPRSLVSVGTMHFASALLEEIQSTWWLIPDRYHRFSKCQKNVKSVIGTRDDKQWQRSGGALKDGCTGVADASARASLGASVALRRPRPIADPAPCHR